MNIRLVAVMLCAALIGFQAGAAEQKGKDKGKAPAKPAASKQNAASAVMLYGKISKAPPKPGSSSAPGLIFTRSTGEKGPISQSAEDLAALQVEKYIGQEVVINAVPVYEGKGSRAKVIGIQKIITIKAAPR